MSSNNQGICAPNINIKSHYTCFKYTELYQIAIAFNHYISKQNQVSSISLKQKTIPIYKQTKKQLWNSIYKKLDSFCKYESCWINQKFINIINDKTLKDKIRFFTFKPKMVTNWLSTDDINQVLNQYQEKYSNFKFLGALPADFYKVIKINYNELLQHNKIGIIFNLDNHNQTGSHWVAFFIDNQKQTIEYFDSTGRKPNYNISKFISNVLNLLQQQHLNYNLKINNIQHQFGNNECGIYSIYFIIQRLKNKSFEKISHNVILDHEMNKFRFNIFRTKN